MLKKALLAFGIATLTIGCGGSGDFQAGTYASIYRGAYSGTWSSATLGEHGTISFRVSDNGAVNGTLARTSDSGNLVGTIDHTGRLYATAGASSGAGTYMISGTVVLQSGHLLSNFTFNYMGVDYGGTFDTTPSGS